MRQVVNNSGFKRKSLFFSDFRRIIQFIHKKNKGKRKQTDVPIFDYAVKNNAGNIGLVPKFRKNSTCRAPVSKAKIHNINTIGDDRDTVYNNENPFCRSAINPVMPEPERNNL
jgi:hypothetical protein